MDRRGFFKFLGGAAAAPIAAKFPLPEIVEPEVVTTTSANSLLTPNMIAKEALRMLRRNVSFSMSRGELLADNPECAPKVKWRKWEKLNV